MEGFAAANARHSVIPDADDGEARPWDCAAAAPAVEGDTLAQSDVNLRSISC
jgi:hypothetical protein